MSKYYLDARNKTMPIDNRLNTKKRKKRPRGCLGRGNRRAINSKRLERVMDKTDGQAITAGHVGHKYFRPVMIFKAHCPCIVRP